MNNRLKRLVSKSATKIQSPVPNSTNIRAKTAREAGTASIGGLFELGGVVFVCVGTAARDTNEMDDELDAEENDAQ